MSYTGLTAEQIKLMLGSTGAAGLDDLFCDVPAGIQLKRIDGLPEPLSEMEIERVMDALASSNRAFRKTFLGAGAYNHYIPPAVDEIASRSEFYTSYTPYQPEVSQGTLAAIFEFQTMMCSLTGLDVTNASMYDGATALAESAMMGIRTNGRNRVLVSRGVHPHYRRVLATYAWAAGFRVEEIPLSGGLTDAAEARRLFNDETSSVIIQSPNFAGAIEDIGAFGEITSGGPAVLITAVAEAMSMGLLKGPGELGADIVCGEVQSFGNPLSFGGPYAGYISARKEFTRRMPGRLAGRTRDAAGNTAYALTLQTREQHIRREKATSNICTNEGLIALRAAVYLSLTGVKLRDIALLNHNTAAYLREKIDEEGMEIVHQANPFFNEFIVRPGNADRFMQEFYRRGINPGLDMGTLMPEYGGCILVCATEMISRDDADEYIRVMKEEDL